MNWSSSDDLQWQGLSAKYPDVAVRRSHFKLAIPLIKYGQQMPTSALWPGLCFNALHWLCRRPGTVEGPETPQESEGGPEGVSPLRTGIGVCVRQNEPGLRNPGDSCG